MMNTIVKRATLTLAKQHRPIAARIARVAMSTNPFAVESPEGVNADMEREENLQWDNQVIDYEAAHGAAEIKYEKEQAAKIMYVDAPDGITDAETMDNLKWDQDVIEFAAEHEDTETIQERHETDTKVREQQARSSEHNW